MTAGTALAGAAFRCAGAWRRRLPALLLLLLLVLTPHAAHAHKPSDAYLRLRVDGALVEQRFDVALRDLDRDLELDADQNGLLDWREVRTRWADIEALAAQGVAVSADGRPCSAGPPGTPLLDEHSDGRYAVLTRRWTCPQPVRSLAVSYGLFALSDPSHRGIVRVLRGADGGSGETAVLTPSAPPRVFAPDGAAGDAGGRGGAAPGAAAGTRGGQAPGGWRAGFLGFVPEGVHHILIGSDHILFLLALLLPALLVRRRAATGISTVPPMRAAASAVARMPAAGSAMAMAMAPPLGPGVGTGVGTGASGLGTTGSDGVGGSSASRPAGGWQPAPSLRPVLADVLRVVTAFTVAHSITLALAAFDVVNPPSRWVESIIAASVALAAMNNLFPVFREGRWKLTFVFGLVHGFGFASALKDIGLTQGALVGPLLGFNVGVELGQLAIVAVFITAAWRLRTTRFYAGGLLTLGSIAIVLLALGWLVERAFDVKLPLPL